VIDSRYALDARTSFRERAANDSNRDPDQNYDVVRALSSSTNINAEMDRGRAAETIDTALRAGTCD
jgi:hypothetical protein